MRDGGLAALALLSLVERTVSNRRRRCRRFCGSLTFRPGEALRIPARVDESSVSARRRDGALAALRSGCQRWRRPGRRPSQPPSGPRGAPNFTERRALSRRPVPQSACDEKLVETVAVEVAGVEQRDSTFEGGTDGRDVLRVIAPSVDPPDASPHATQRTAGRPPRHHGRAASLRRQACSLFAPSGSMGRSERGW